MSMTLTAVDILMFGLGPPTVTFDSRIGCSMMGAPRMACRFTSSGSLIFGGPLMKPVSVDAFRLTSVERKRTWSKPKGSE